MSSESLRTFHPSLHSRPRQSTSSYAPISGSEYFSQATQVSVPDSKLEFRVYYTPPKFADGTVMICHHGAGYSGLSFALLAKEIEKASDGECGVLAFDCRGHGTLNNIHECLYPVFNPLVSLPA